MKTIEEFYIDEYGVCPSIEKEVALHSYYDLIAFAKKWHENELKNLQLGAVSGSVAYAKVSKLLSALNDIRNWDDDLEDKWEDQGYRAKAALAEYYKGNDR